MNFVWKINDGETQSIVLVLFVLWQCFNHRWMRGGGLGGESCLDKVKIASFSNRDFSRINKHDTFWYVVSTGDFYVLIL